MKKSIMSIILSIFLLVGFIFPASAATIVKSQNGAKIKLFKNSSIGVNITDNNVYHVGDAIYPNLYDKSGTCWRSGAYNMGDSSTIMRGATIDKNNCFVLKKAGTYKIVGSYSGVYCELQIVVV